MKYVCTICGYVYDDAKNPVPFEQLPEDWTCPLCGAPKSAFEKVDDGEKTEKKAQPAPAPEKKRETVRENDEELVRLTPGELSALFSNLERGCEKQYQEEAMNCFHEIASYFESVTPEETDLDLKHLADLIREDLDTNYAALVSAAKDAGDRGTLRVTTWGEKVTRMAAGLLNRYFTQGEDFLKNTGLYVCTVCGFLYVGDNPPELCPVCKVPSWKFEKIDGRAM